MRKLFGDFMVTLDKRPGLLFRDGALVGVFHHEDGDEFVSKPSNFVASYDSATFMEPAEGALSMRMHSPRCVMGLETRLEVQSWIKNQLQPKPKFDFVNLEVVEFQVTRSQWNQLGNEIDQLGVYRSPDRVHQTMLVLVDEVKQQDQEDYADYCRLMTTITKSLGFELPESAQLLVINLSEGV